MKFAKELEREAVPEWRIKYLNYKAGKKYVKAVSRAINRTPKGFNRTPSAYRTSNLGRSSVGPGASKRFSTSPNGVSHGANHPKSDPIPVSKPTESAALADDDNKFQYGSFVATPPEQSPLARRTESHDFSLPAPAMQTPESPDLSRPSGTMKRNLTRLPLQRRASEAITAVATTAEEHRAAALHRRPSHWGTIAGSPSQLRRMLSQAHNARKGDISRSDSVLTDFDLVREREREFYEFMETELEKVETFYKTKEDQASQRLSVLRQQLHEMRNRRIQELCAPDDNDHDGTSNTEVEHSHDGLNGWVHPIKAKIFPPGPNSKALRNMPTTPFLPASTSAGDATRDYSRRRQKEDVSYRTAKRKLKLALQEFYRGLELLKSYAMLNRTAFRKLNKKFDKAANARPPQRFMSEKVNKAWFVNSELVDGHIRAVEDLYARYFERGNHKIAVSKLRSLSKKSADESGSSFLNGFLIGTGLIFTVQGLIYGVQLLDDSDPDVRENTSYVLQLYGGFFLMLLMFGFFCIDCFVWTRNKINYPFIFEFDQRSHIDWRRLAEFPSFFLLLLGIFMWMNFSRYGADWLYIYYPVILISVSAAIIFFPAPIMAHKSRQWLIYAHWRLLLAGFYPVEFRDFFLGDMYCSLTYAMANVELFFCLYAHKWNDPAQCNSNHSRLLGFLMTLPPIWRFLQCLRRYRDTRNVFPHLVNGGKYIMTIVSTVILSLYRLENTRTKLALYITFSIINGLYVSVWDLFMDFSLLQTESRHYALRDILALKERWPYYLIMVVDPILRFSWIFYAIFTHNTQHSTFVSFLVSLAEVSRRGMWALFRVENEHCANVSQYKASRDVPLPYRIEPLIGRASADTSPTIHSNGDEDSESHSTGRRPQVPQSTSSSTAVASTLGTLRRRTDTTSARSFSKILASAHKQDFEKRRKPGAEGGDVEENSERSDDDDDDDDDLDHEEEEDILLEAGRSGEARRTHDARRRHQ